MTAPTPRDVLTRDNARDYGEFGLFIKVGQTLISLFTVPPGVSYQTPEGLRAEDEETRIAFDVQGGVYPIRESVFQRSYAEAALTRREPLDVEVLARTLTTLDPDTGQDDWQLIHVSQGDDYAKSRTEWAYAIAAEYARLEAER